jgi:hypothetical protein
MKMAKSSTRKKNNPFPEEATKVINAAADYIKHWTDRELARLQTENKVPLCIPVKNGYRIGSYRLQVLPNNTCELHNNSKELVHVFENKLSAVLYTIYTIKQKYNAADEILFWDREINKHYTDILNLRRSIVQSRKRQDYVTVDIRSARLDQSETSLEFARDKISKLYNHAKYIKVWG